MLTIIIKVFNNNNSKLPWFNQKVIRFRHSDSPILASPQVTRTHLPRPSIKSLEMLSKEFNRNSLTVWTLHHTVSSQFAWHRVVAHQLSIMLTRMCHLHIWILTSTSILTSKEFHNLSFHNLLGLNNRLVSRKKSSWEAEVPCLESSYQITISFFKLHSQEYLQGQQMQKIWTWILPCTNLSSISFILQSPRNWWAEKSLTRHIAEKILVAVSIQAVAKQITQARLAFLKRLQTHKPVDQEVIIRNQSLTMLGDRLSSKILLNQWLNNWLPKEG